MRPFLLLLAAGLLWSCRTEPVTWRVPLHDVILLHDTLDWSTLVPDTLWQDGEQGLMLHLEGERPLIRPEDLVFSLDTAWSTTFDVPFIGGPIPLAPGTVLWTEVEEVGLNIPDVLLRRLRLGEGSLVISVESSVQGPLELVYTLEGATFPAGSNGGSNAIEVAIQPAANTVVAHDLSGVVLDLNDEDGVGFGTLRTGWQIGVPEAAAEPVPIFGTDVLSLEVAFVGVGIAQAEGRFGQRTLDLETQVDLTGWDALEALEIQWASVDFNLRLINTAGVDLGLSLEEFSRVDTLDGLPQTTLLDDPAIGGDVLLARALVAETGGMADWQIDPTEATIQLGTEGSGLPAFLGSIPDAFGLKAQVELNPFGDVSGGFDRMDLGRMPRVGWTCHAPLEVGYSRALWRDTLDPAMPDGVDYDGDLNISVESSLPVGARIRLSLVEVPDWMLTLAWPNDPWTILPEMVIAPGSGAPGMPAISEVQLSLDTRHTGALRDGARIVAEVEWETPEEGAQFSPDQRVVIRGHLQGDLILSVE